MTVGDVLAGARFVRRLRPFLAASAGGGAAGLERGLERREEAFRELVEGAVLGHSGSPYRRLLAWAGVEPGDVHAMLGEGLDAALVRLHDAGVRVSLEEFKGTRPIVRPGLEVHTGAESFDNPLGEAAYEARTGGSGGTPRRVFVDLRLLAHEAAYHQRFLAAAGALGRPAGIWHPAPPASVGVKTALIAARLGRPAERWFSQTPPRGTAPRHAAFTATTAAAARALGTRVPRPVFTPPPQAAAVARWLAAKVAAGAPAVLFTTPSSGVRACSAALEAGLDVHGTFLVLVGEPYTAAKAAVVEAAGAHAACHYAMVECGLIGVACARGEALDDVHLTADKVATIARPVNPGRRRRPVEALFHTTLLRASPKVMLNVESGDTGALVRRACGCGALPRAFDRHLHSIRSYEKLTGEGANFAGEDVLRLVEEVLPARFGGGPTDYQFVEREEGGVARVDLLVGSAVGPLDGDDAARAVLDYLRGRGETVMTRVWADGRTLAVVRDEPAVTPAGKTLPLRTLGA